MIVIASEDRTWGISTGGGLNQAISQADLDSVGNTRLAPALAAGDATGGAVATITQLTYAMDPLASTAATTWVTLAAQESACSAKPLQIASSPGKIGGCG